MLHISFTQEISNLQIAISKFRSDDLRYGLIHLEGVINGALCLFDDRSLDDINLIREFVDEILQDGFDEYEQFSISEALENDDDDLGEFDVDEYGMIQSENSELLMRRYLWFDYTDEEDLLFHTVAREDDPDTGKIFTEYKNLSDIKRHELYGALSLNFIYKILENNEGVPEILNYSLKSAKAMLTATLVKASSDNSFEKIKEIEKNFLTTRAKKAAFFRHRINNQTREQLLKEFDLYALQQIEKGEVVSKTQFAKDVASKYGMAETTIRNNWLKGYNPKSNP